MKRHLPKIYIKTDAKSHLQNLADKPKNYLKQIEMKEAQVMKVRAKITSELDSEIEKIPKTRKKKECRSGYSLGKTTKYLRINKKY